MLIVLDGEHQTATITFNQVQFTILAPAIEADPAGFERLLMGYLQTKQLEQDEAEKAEVQALLADKDQRQAILNSMKREQKG